MAKFIVFKREVHVQGYEVDANDEGDALRKAVEDEGDLLEDRFEYSHTLDPETWTVEKVGEEGKASPFCLKCGVHFATHNDDGSCVSDKDEEEQRKNEPADWKKAYIEIGGVRCPYCLSSDITGDFIQTEQGSAFQKVSCVCGKSWTDVYTLVNVEEGGA